MAVFSLIAALVLLAGMALFSVRPWEDDLLAPQVGIPPGGGIGLGDSVALTPPERSHVADTEVADVGRSTFVAKPVAAKGAVPTLGLSQRRPVQLSTATPSPTSPPEAPPPLPAEPVAVPAEPVLVVAPAPPPPYHPPPAPHLVANFEDGLRGWSGSVGDVFPGIVSGIVRDGNRASVVRLTHAQSGSHLVFGDVEGGAVQIREGDVLAFGFSFYIQAMVYGWPGADNSIMRLVSDSTDSQAFGLQLWDQAPGADGGGRGLWSSGGAMGGDRFLAPVPERVWHDLVIGFVASSQGLGSYELYLDGRLIDARSGVSIIAPGGSHAQIEVGLLRDGDLVQGTSEIRIDAAKLAGSLESVLG